MALKKALTSLNLNLEPTVYRTERPIFSDSLLQLAHKPLAEQEISNIDISGPYEETLLALY